jgi:hypothetical protein
MACHLDGTATNIKGRIRGKECTIIDQQRLIFAGKQLGDDHGLSDCDVEMDSALHLILSLRGGGT